MRSRVLKKDKKNGRSSQAVFTDDGGEEFHFRCSV